MPAKETNLHGARVLRIARLTNRHLAAAAPTDAGVLGDLVSRVREVETPLQTQPTSLPVEVAVCFAVRVFKQA
jgi:hypothetical protein